MKLNRTFLTGTILYCILIVVCIIASYNINSLVPYENIPLAYSVIDIVIFLLFLLFLIDYYTGDIFCKKEYRPSNEFTFHDFENMLLIESRNVVWDCTYKRDKIIKLKEILITRNYNRKKEETGFEINVFKLLKKRKQK